MLGFLAGQIYFRAEGGTPEQLLNQCREKGIPLSDIKGVELGFEAKVPTRNYAALCKLAEKKQCHIFQLKQTKAVAPPRLFVMRPGLVVGPLLLLCIIAFSGNIIWAVRFDGVELPDVQSIRQQLYGQGIYEGAWMDEQKLQQVHQTLMQQGQYGWLALNFYRGRLVIEKSDQLEQPLVEAKDTSDLVSMVDGTITEIQVTGGDILCLVGQQIAKEQLLVSGNYLSQEGKAIHTRSKGKIYAQTKQTYHAQQPLQQEVEIPSSHTHTNVFMHFLGQRFSLGKIYKPTEQEQVTIRYSPLTILGFALPVTVERQQLMQAQQQSITLTQQQALELAKLSCRQQLEQDFPNCIVQAEGIQWEVKDGAIHLTMEFTAVVQAAKEVKSG